MNDDASEHITSVLHALAALSPDSTDAAEPLAVPLAWFRWLEMSAVNAFTMMPGAEMPPRIEIDSSYAERVAALSQVRGGTIARLGWLWIAGSFVDADGKTQRIFQPLVHAPVHVWRQPITGTSYVGKVGDVTLSLLIQDVHTRHELERGIEYGGGGIGGKSIELSQSFLARLPRLQAFAAKAAKAAGFPDVPLVPATDGPDDFMRLDKVVVVAGVGLYCREEDKADLSRAASLRRWAEEDLGNPTALHAIYDDSPQIVEADDDELLSPFRLTPTQARAVRTSRTNPITVVQGAPGTGKSHTIAAIALDQVRRGGSVLVVAKTDATVDALIELLEQCPGPNPVVFGANDRREALADRLSAGGLAPVAGTEVERCDLNARRLERQRVTARKSVIRLLEIEYAVQRGHALAAIELSLADAKRRAAELRSLAEEANMTSGFFRRRHARRAMQRLRDLVGAVEGASDNEVLADAQDEINAVAARELIAGGGLAIEELWNQLAFLDRTARVAHGEYMSVCYRESFVVNDARPAISALAVALRSGRAARREQLHKLRPQEITRALPLWIGTLADVDDLLPLQPGFFDLVILDEAASVEQALAAPALLRGRRAVVAGDPRQLRQVSFLSDAEIHRALDDAGIEDTILRARLDVRRNSALDAAIGVAQPIVLDEHFRSSPHLVDFVARKFYGGRVKVATRKPSTHSHDCVEVIRCDGDRDEQRVVTSEVDRVLAVLRVEKARCRSIGIVTPFRSQADAIEAAVLKAYRSDELEAMDLRIGTVHAFQGIERDLVIVSLGAGSSKRAWAFAEDPSLAAVMLTRARRRLVMVFAGDPPERGLLAAYLAQANAPPGPPAPATAPSPWVAAIHEEAERAGVSLLLSYPTGRHIVDLVLAEEWRDVAIEADVHPGGPESHIRRRLEMMDRGWSFIEAYRSRWLGREAELAIELVNQLRR